MIELDCRTNLPFPRGRDAERSVEGVVSVCSVNCEFETSPS
jgi:hypothetical protein